MTAGRGEWTAYLGLTMTGLKGPILDSASGGLTVTLNDHDELDITFARRSIDGVEEDFWAWKSGCVLLVYTDEFGIERLPAVCPISSPHPEEDRATGTMTLQAKGPSWLLEDRVVLDKDYTQATAPSMRSRNVSVRQKSFSAIVAEIVHRSTETKWQGHLPLVLPSRLTPGGHDRTYEGFNVSNNGAWKRIQELTEVIGGPDVQLRPEWADADHTHFRWRLIVGTDEQMTLPQTRDMFWDGTAPDTDVASVSVSSSADDVAHRVYATGAGEGAAVTLAQADVKSLPQHLPLTEKVISDSDAEGDTGTALLLQKALGALSNRSIDQVSLTVRADPGRNPIGSWWCGELATVTTSGWKVIPDGEHLLRVISAKYTLGSDMVDLECQEDYLTKEYTW